jgi:hypothetical protein
MSVEKLDMFNAAWREDTPKLPSSVEVFEALHNVEGLDEDFELDLYDIPTVDLCKFESMMALPPQRSDGRQKEKLDSETTKEVNRFSCENHLHYCCELRKFGLLLSFL